MRSFELLWACLLWAVNRGKLFPIPGSILVATLEKVMSTSMNLETTSRLHIVVPYYSQCLWFNLVEKFIHEYLTWPVLARPTWSFHLKWAYLNNLRIFRSTKFILDQKLRKLPVGSKTLKYLQIKFPFFHASCQNGLIWIHISPTSFV